MIQCQGMTFQFQLRSRELFSSGSCHCRFVKICSAIIHHQQADKCCCNCYGDVWAGCFNSGGWRHPGQFVCEMYRVINNSTDLRDHNNSVLIIWNSSLFSFVEATMVTLSDSCPLTVDTVVMPDDCEYAQPGWRYITTYLALPACSWAASATWSLLQQLWRPLWKGSLDADCCALHSSREQNWGCGSGVVFIF